MEDGFPEQDICINGFESGSSGHSKVCSVTTVCGQSEMEEQQIEDLSTVGRITETWISECWIYSPEGCLDHRMSAGGKWERQ